MTDHDATPAPDDAAPASAPTAGVSPALLFAFRASLGGRPLLPENE